MDKQLQQEDTVSADRKERIIFDQNTGKSRKISSVVSRQNFNNAKYGNRKDKKDGDINFVTGTAPVPEQVKEAVKSFSQYQGLEKEDKPGKVKTAIVKMHPNAVEGETVEGWKDEKKPVKEETMTLDEQIVEVLSKDASAGAWIHDFIKSDNPKFEGKSKEKRKEMALAAYYAKQRNEEVELGESKDTVTKDASGKVTSWKHEGDWKKSDADTVTDKSGAKHTPQSRVRHLARMALKQQTNEGTEMDKLTFKQFTEQLDELVEFVESAEQLDEYNSKDGVYRHKGTYGGAYVDPEGADDADDKPKAAPAPVVKKGRGRPAGSYGTYKARSAETKAAAAAKSAASKAANKAK